MKEEAADCHMLLRMIGGTKCLATGLDALLPSFSTSRRIGRQSMRFPEMRFKFHSCQAL